MKVRKFLYRKETGEESLRKVIVVAEPRQNYLCYDVTNLSSDEATMLQNILKDAEYDRDCHIELWEKATHKKINSLWRSFKPGGIDWLDEPS
jgi:hypothetical protein